MKIQEKAPLVSVVMPAYNVEKYVEEAVRSILDQTFLDFEFIIVDDGSTDRTPEILRSFSDPRIRLLFNEKNEGNYPARNRGCRLARGKYIAVMDADDVAMPERLEKQVNYLESNPNLVALGSEYSLSSRECKNNVPLKYEDICFSLLKDFSLLHPSLMVKSSIFYNLGGYNEEYIYASDYDLFCRLALSGEVENLSDILMIYRKHEKQISSSKKGDQGKFAYKIRQKYQVAFVNKYKSFSQASVSLIEVGLPEIGLAMCYYTYANHSNRSEYVELADKMIDVVCKIVTKDIPICVENGLCGLGCGLQYLIQNRFLDGDINEILEDIDLAVIREYEKSSNKYLKNELMLYINYRNLNLIQKNIVI